MRSSKDRPRLAAVLLPLLAVVGMSIPGSSSAATNGPGEDSATRQLFAAVQTNDFQAVQTSIAAGADVDARNPWGNTAADMAVDKGYFRIAHYLVSIRNFQRTKAEPSRPAPATADARPAPATADARAALVQAKPPAAPSAAAASSRKTSPAGAAPAMPSSSAPTPGATASAGADRNAAVLPTLAGSADAFDPSRPAYGAILPAAAAKNPEARTQ